MVSSKPLESHLSEGVGSRMVERNLSLEGNTFESCYPLVYSLQLFYLVNPPRLLPVSPVPGLVYARKRAIDDNAKSPSAVGPSSSILNAHDNGCMGLLHCELVCVCRYDSL